MHSLQIKLAMATNPPLNWSELVPDVLSLVYKRLSFRDFARARAVCSSWYSVSRSSSPRENHVPWLIFKQDRNWQLFNPGEGKFYITQIDHFGFADCRSLATCGSWVLVTDDKAYLYIFNPFTLEIVRLPPLQSYGPSVHKILGNYSFHFDYVFGQRRSVRVDTAVLWVDERTKDYLVAWTSRSSDRLRFCMKGKEMKSGLKHPAVSIYDEEKITEIWIWPTKTRSFTYLLLVVASGSWTFLKSFQEYPPIIHTSIYRSTPITIVARE